MVAVRLGVQPRIIPFLLWYAAEVVFAARLEAQLLQRRLLHAGAAEPARAVEAVLVQELIPQQRFPPAFARMTRAARQSMQRTKCATVSLFRPDRANTRGWDSLTC